MNIVDLSLNGLMLKLSDTRHRWDILIVSNDTESCGGPQADTDCKID
jgi:hypothetical protein